MSPSSALMLLAMSFLASCSVRNGIDHDMCQGMRKPELNRCIDGKIKSGMSGERAAVLLERIGFTQKSYSSGKSFTMITKPKGFDNVSSLAKVEVNKYDMVTSISIGT